MVNIGGGVLYDGTNIQEIETSYGTDMSVQAIGSGTYKVMGKLASDMNYTELTGVAIGNNFPAATEIKDEQIYTYDVSTLSYITVSGVTGFTKIKAIVVTK